MCGWRNGLNTGENHMMIYDVVSREFKKEFHFEAKHASTK